MYEDVTEYSVRYFVHIVSMYGVDLELIWSCGQYDVLAIFGYPSITPTNSRCWDMTQALSSASLR